MANLVQNLLNESAQNAVQAQFTVAQRLAKKWAKSGLLEGLEDYDRANMAMILESQAKQLVTESSQTNGNVAQSAGATFTPGNGEQWAGVALPLVRKIFGQLAAKEFVSVQPMNLPAGLVFYLDFQYGGAGGTSVSNFNGSVYGATSTNFGNAASGGFYGAGRYDYSLNLFSASVSASSIATASAVLFSDVNFDSTYSASIAAGTNLATTSIFKFQITAFSTNFTNFNQNGIRAFEFTSASAIIANNNLNQFNKYNATTDTFTFIYSGSLSAAQYNN